MLSTKRPTSTTVLYTVSTRSAAKTLSAHAASIVLILVRVLTGGIIAALLLHEYRNTFSVPIIGAELNKTLHGLLSSGLLGESLGLIFHHTTRIWRLVLVTITIWLIFHRAYTSESLLIIRGLGVQTSTSSSSYLWTSSTRFIPTSAIQDIFIHEAFKGFEVRYYLSIVVEGEDSVVVVFPVPRNLCFLHQSLVMCGKSDCAM